MHDDMFNLERRTAMFVELDERELMKHDGGGMLLSAWDLCHAIEKFIGKNFR